MTATAGRKEADLPRLAVVYDHGSATFSEIVRFGAPVARLTFVVGQDLQSSPLMSAFGELADIVPFTDIDQASQDLLRLSAGSLDGITTFSERMIPLTGSLAERLGLAFHSPETVLRLTDKARQRQALRDAGVERLRVATIEPRAGIGPALRAVGVPAVLKPVHGEGSRATFRLTDPRHADEALRQARAVVGESARMQLEEMLVGRDARPFGDYVSVESVTDGAGSRHLAMTGKFPLVPPFREAGQYWPASLQPSESAEIAKLTSAALQALGVRTGMTHTEIKLTPSGPRIIEVNGRLGGLMDDLARRSMGTSLITLACAVAVGADAPSPVYQMAEEVVFHFSNLAPLDATDLLSVDGARGLRHGGKVTYRTMTQPGSRLTRGFDTQELDLISGMAGTYEEMFEELRRAVLGLTFRFRVADGSERVLNGSELPSAASLGPFPAD